ncbi:hypothetical protein XI25_04305 [Paenibacillus sp. DMB20]|nr:hypothetical protein XI25_04305 [Paenibacillus sp. DMB20]
MAAKHLRFFAYVHFNTSLPGYKQKPHLERPATAWRDASGWSYWRSLKLNTIKGSPGRMPSWTAFFIELSAV